MSRARARSRAAGAPARTRAALLAAAIAAMLAGCVAGPDYVRPAVATPPAWKLEAPWREGTPDDSRDSSGTNQHTLPRLHSPQFEGG